MTLIDPLGMVVGMPKRKIPGPRIRNRKPGEVAIFRGHAIAPEVHVKWNAIIDDIQRDVEIIREGLKASSAHTPQADHLLASFASNALAEQILFSQLFFWLQWVDHLQATQGLEASEHALSCAMKVVNSVKGPSFQKLVTLKALDVESKRHAIPDQSESLDLTKYLNDRTRNRSTASARMTAGRQVTPGEGTDRSVTTSARSVQRVFDTGQKPTPTNNPPVIP